MKVAYDCELMRPGCVLVAAAMGADIEIARRFDVDHWALHLTPDMKVYEVTEEHLLKITEQHHGIKP